uniref:Uncharacterized protein n=1 Tax=viral metagenome TaxID=1070528 RepID=A0A6C0CFY4_9ZZZZ
MDNQFTTLSRSYRDNYLQYSLTGNQTYKSAYEAAKQGLDNIIQSMTTEVETNSSNLKNAVGADAASLFQDKQAGLSNVGGAIHTQKDRVVEAQMRQPPTPPAPSYITQYLVISGLLGAIVLLQLV